MMLVIRNAVSKVTMRDCITGEFLFTRIRIGNIMKQLVKAVVMKNITVIS